MWNMAIDILLFNAFSRRWAGLPSALWPAPTDTYLCADCLDRNPTIRIIRFHGAGNEHNGMT